MKALAKRFPTRSGVLRRVTGGVDAVDGVSLDIPAGTTLGLVGESGSGKSTLARLVVRIIEPTAGSVMVDGTDVTVLSGAELGRSRRQMQMVFQDPYSSLDPSHTIGDTVSEPLLLHTDLKPEARRERTRELLALVGMGDVPLDRYPHQFSGGQRQRIAIARALAVNPSLLVCDEAVSALDVSTQAQVLNLLAELQDSWARPTCSSPTISPWSVTSPTASPSCTWARSWRRVRSSRSSTGPPTRTPRHCSRPSRYPTRPWPGSAGGWCSGARWRPTRAEGWVAGSRPGARSPWTCAARWTLTRSRRGWHHGPLPPAHHGTPVWPVGPSSPSTPTEAGAR